MNWGECYFDHFGKLFRTAVAREKYSQGPDEHSIQVLAYDGVFQGCRVFASLGLTHYSEQVGQIAEVYLPADAAWDRVPALLANALFYVVQEGMHIGWGIGIGGVGNLSPEFEREYGKTALYVTSPFGLPEGAALVKCNGEQGRLYVAVFITGEEYEFFLMHGAERLEEVMQEKAVDPYSLARPSCV